MLTDVEFKHPGAQMGFILGAISGGSIIPQKISQGMYVCGHWSIDQLGVPIRERWREEPYVPSDFPKYGVCDFPEQVLQKFPLADAPEKYFVTFVKISKADQEPCGGWRWHKWGEYIGDKNPQYEYLYDEKDIDEVYTFSIYELPNDQ